MKLLLDTHALLWFASDDPRLTSGAVRAMEADSAVLYVSVATVWELAIKSSIGRLTLPLTVDRYIAAKVAEGYRVLDLEWKHVAATERLPWHHRDPFDRVLAAQAMAEGLPLVTHDKAFRKYGVKTIW